MEPIGEASILMPMMPRDLSSDSLRYSEDGYFRNLHDDETPRKEKSSKNINYISINEKSPNSSPKDDKVTSSAKKSSKIKIKKKNSIGSMNPVELQPTIVGYNNQCLAVPIPNNNKSHSLPPNSSIQDLDDIVMSALRIPPEELAQQITLLDLTTFQQIKMDELTSCAWTKKNKGIITPNIVAFTRRFNHTSFWTVQEILNGGAAKERAEIITHFIKLGKRLLELNNLHSLFAVTSALKSASVHRLEKTWSHVSKKDRQSFEKLADIFKEDNNWANLREICDKLKLPCIPYLGVYLTDLIYIDLAHPLRGGGIEPEQREIKMNNILRVISIYQNSDYSHIPVVERTRKYLQSVRYIEELQNIFEDEQYKKSLKLEPPAKNQAKPDASTSSMNQGANNFCNLESGIASLNVSPAKSSSMRLNVGPPTKFSLGHRKTQSLGSKYRSASLPRNYENHKNQNCNCNNATLITLSAGSRCSSCRIFHKISNQITLQRNESFNHSRNFNLIDDSVLEDTTSTHHNSLHLPLQSDTISTGSSDDIIAYDESESSIINNIDSPLDCASFQGCVRRKTVLKDFRKPTVASWQRYWLQIWANSLVYFPPKSFKGSERSDFKREPCKVVSLVDGWTVELTDNSSQTNTFQLMNSSIGTVYKFRCSSHDLTIAWLKALQKVTRPYVEKLPTNLMTFE
ncbi:ras-specific guanine nucleotide-releasing factor RalGPS1 isoform X2 [Chironomus tepperi]|uniref:ras-specific guanine nucleotide-releasing factor RalGPS1 isoform X2 n=1 Tax=Chironomus tepperi TaxID=113505 RepID=UPI00391F459C